jgi:voltage-gated potassium channel Kch
VESIAYFDGIYFAVVTFSTVGLGDVVPKTTIGKLKYCPQNTFSNSSK